MITLEITPAEVAARRIAGAHLMAAINAIREDGFVVLNGTTDLDHIDALYQRMREDRQRLDAAGEVMHEGRGNQDMPRDPALVFPDIVQNPIAAQVMSAVIGEGVAAGMYTSNISMPGCPEQFLHVDQSPRRAEDLVGYPTNCIVMNIPLVDFTVENGATEVWPGTHMVPCSIGSRAPNETEQAERAAIAPPERACMTRGAVLLRDIRLWHRGPGNNTDVYRPMVAMILNGGFDPMTREISSIPCAGKFPEATRGIFEAGPIWYHIEYQL